MSGAGVAAPAGVYVHVPYCRVRCPYCAFVLVETREERFAGFVAAVRGEMERVEGHPRAGSVYFGGGTPSLLAPEEISAILSEVRLRFDLDPEAEVTVEVNPDGLSRRWLEEVLAAGVNRVSLGVQAFDDAALRFLGRTHTAAQARDAVEVAREAGVRNLNLDLMYGLPGENVAVWQERLGRAVASSPEHISVYGLTVEPGTLLARSRPALPREEVLRDLYLAAYDELVAAGYEPYELSNYAQPGFRSRHNWAAWTGAPYYGFGPGAHSYAPPERWANPSNVRLYVQSGGRVAPMMRERLSAEQIEIERVWLSLRTIEGLEERARGEAWEREAQLLVEAGLLERVGARVRLTRPGRVVADEVVGRLVAALPGGFGA